MDELTGGFPARAVRATSRWKSASPKPADWQADRLARDVRSSARRKKETKPRLPEKAQEDAMPGSFKVAFGGVSAF
jgi:hypothetical protein